MSGKPAARIADPTVCPLPGHGTNPIATGSPNVQFDHLAAARHSDVSACGSPIVSAVSATVFINGKPAATLGSVGGHGNVIVGGSGTVIIGDSVTSAPFIPVTPLSLAKAPFSGRFQVVDYETGLPAAGRRVKVWSSGGWSSVETTDGQGMTSWVKHDAAHTLHIDLLQGAAHE